jgi:hypothetical protein
MDVTPSVRIEPEPAVGEIVHGTIINTGYLQRLEIFHSNYRGRISADQEKFVNGALVEAEVTVVGTRSLDVRILGETCDSFGNPSINQAM